MRMLGTARAPAAGVPAEAAEQRVLSAPGIHSGPVRSGVREHTITSLPQCLGQG